MNIARIIRTRRKTYALIIEPDGSLVVRAPLQATEAQIAAVVEKKRAWIQAKQALVAQAPPRVPARQFTEGERFLYLGRAYPLALADRQAEALKLSDRFTLARPAWERASEVFTAWYRQRALEIISARAAWYANQYGFSYTRIRIMSARTRWGSCSPRGGLNFTWRLVMAPLDVIDYVVVHELAHLKIRNHSKAFWDQVEALLPGYRRQVAWLKRYGNTLTIQ